MKHSLPLIFLALLVMTSCGKPGDKVRTNATDAPEDTDPNEALYNQVESKHVDVMLKMDDLYKYQVKLKEKIAKTPAMPAVEKQQIESIIASLDSADRNMKNWMHGWMNSPADTADQEKMRAYFESQMQAILQLDEQINEVIERAKAKSEQ